MQILLDSDFLLIFLGPRPILECDNGNITIKFDSSENPYLFLGDLNVVGSGNAPCNPNKYQDLTHLVISIPFEECDTQRRVRQWDQYYKFTNTFSIKITLYLLLKSIYGKQIEGLTKLTKF